MSSSKQHSRHHDTFRKKQKLHNQIKGGVFALLVVAILLTGHYFYACAAVVLAYLIHELLWSDHIFYDPRSDYNFSLQAQREQQLRLKGSIVKLDEIAADATYLLKVQVRATAGGHIFDPYVETSTGNTTLRQYFERRLNGTRYLNITALVENLKQSTAQLTISAHHCQIDGDLTLLQFSNPALTGKKVLVIAPHADDAELAAFGLYNHHDSTIVTLTAGEIGAEYYRQLTGSTPEASRLKGRLRSWDSVMVPQWGGVKPLNTMQLGYFCLTLEQMAANPDVAVTSRTAEVNDTRYFRAFNAIKLASDNNGSASWNNLVQDLMEVLEKYQPQVIVTPHPTIDPHRDHLYATMALMEACEKLGWQDKTFLLYANHYRHCDMFPFGPATSVASLPPEFGHNGDMAVYSYTLSARQRQDKVAAIAMMHDLRTPLKPRKKLRQLLQHLIIERDISPYGDDEYLRKAPRCNELFFHLNMAQLRRILDSMETGK